MKPRDWRQDLISGVFVILCAAGITLALFLWDRGHSCYNQIQVGMTSTEADAILLKHGFVLVHLDGNLSEILLVYKRGKTESPIILICSRDGIVTMKERDSEVENALQNLSRSLRSD